MKDESHETHHVFTDDEVETERKKISYIGGRHPFEVKVLLPTMITFLVVWIGLEAAATVQFGILIDGSYSLKAFVTAALYAAAVGLTAWLIVNSDPSEDPLEPLSGDDFKTLRGLAEKNSSVAVWVREALEDDRTLRKRDLRAAGKINYLRVSSEKEIQAKQSEEEALQELRASVQRVDYLGEADTISDRGLALNIAASFATDADSVLAVFQLATGVQLSPQQVGAAKAAGLEVAASGEPSVRSLVERWAQVDGLAEFAAAVKAATMPN